MSTPVAVATLFRYFEDILSDHLRPYVGPYIRTYSGQAISSSTSPSHLRLHVSAATRTRSLPDRTVLHVSVLACMGGVPHQIVSGNLRAGITRACFYETLVNRTYADMAAHYGTAVIPARPYKPRDKGKVEVAVQVVQ
jgi:transposase